MSLVDSGFFVNTTSINLKCRIHPDAGDMSAGTAAVVYLHNFFAAPNTDTSILKSF
jgi:hypothetical protein